MTHEIKQSNLTSRLTKHIYKLFAEHAIDIIGIDGFTEEPVSFEIRKGKKLIACVVVKIFWGQLHIEHLVVDKKYRNHGYGKKLMEQAFAWGKSRNCQFAFVETMSFQAPVFYQKLGFKVELKRNGYEQGTSFYYLRKRLT